AFEFFRNAQLNANDFFYNRDNPNSQTTKQVLNQNQFGGALGGPVKKDKIFVFGSYQGTRSRNGVDTVGKFSALLPGVPAGDRTRAAWMKQLIADNCGPTAPSILPSLPCSATAVSTPALRILQLKNPDGSYFVPTTGDFLKQTAYSIPAVYQDDQVVINGD